MRAAPLVAFVIACGGGQKVAQVTVDPLPQPSASVAPVVDHAPSIAAFLDAGCKTDPGSASALDCKGARIDGVDACKLTLHLLPVSFDPPAVVAECFTDEARGRGVRTVGCMIRSSVRLIAATSHGFVVIDSPDALAKTFAPVTSPAEAFAFAVALTGSEVVKATDADAKQLGVSTAREDGDGFRVKLFTTPMCGCSHATSAVDYGVTREGVVHEIDRKEVWEDPRSRGLCVD